MAEATDGRMDDSGGYDLEPEAPRAASATPAPSRPALGARRPPVDTDDDSVDVDPSHAHGDAAADEMDRDDSLPPPISAPTNPQLWFIVAGVCLALICISWLAGAPQLSLPVATAEGARVPELGFWARVSGVARTLVYMPLATLAAVFGILCLAFLRQRPVGDAAGLFAKCAAIIGFGMLVWLVPSEIRFVKQLLNVLGAPILAGAAAMPLFRLSPRDAGLATMCSAVGMVLLVLTAAIVVWATGA